MCLIFLSFNQHPEFPLIVAANRDEFYNRPATPLDFWQENPKILAGKDLSGGGTWLGVSKTGYFGMLTNYRDMANLKLGAPTRGKLVIDYLAGEFDPSTYLQALDANASKYNGYNIILGKLNDPWYYSNENHKIYRLGTGLYGLSNAFIDTDWPKVTLGKEHFRQVIEQDSFDTEDLFALMNNKELASDDDLPNTGIGYEKEKLLSSMYIEMSGYGTRNTTILTKDREGNVKILERTYSTKENLISDKEYEFSISS